MSSDTLAGNMHHLLLSHSHTTSRNTAFIFTCVWSWCALNPSSVSAFIHALALYVYIQISYRCVSWCYNSYNCHSLPLRSEIWVWSAHDRVPQWCPSHWQWKFFTSWCRIHPRLRGILACAMMLDECMFDLGYCRGAVKDCRKRLWHHSAMGESRLNFYLKIESEGFVMVAETVSLFLVNTHTWVSQDSIFIQQLSPKALWWGRDSPYFLDQYNHSHSQNTLIYSVNSCTKS